VDLELRHCVSEGTLSELDLAHVSKCALGRQQNPHSHLADLVFPLHACVFQVRSRIIKINLKSFEQFSSVLLIF
jgi:hypothetical protein